MLKKKRKKINSKFIHQDSRAFKRGFVLFQIISDRIPELQYARYLINNDKSETKLDNVN